jgi:hypothetical protein
MMQAAVMLQNYLAPLLLYLLIITQAKHANSRWRLDKPDCMSPHGPRDNLRIRNWVAHAVSTFPNEARGSVPQEERSNKHREPQPCAGLLLYNSVFSDVTYPPVLLVTSQSASKLYLVDPSEKVKSRDCRAGPSPIQLLAATLLHSSVQSLYYVRRFITSEGCNSNPRVTFACLR